MSSQISLHLSSFFMTVKSIVELLLVHFLEILSVKQPEFLLANKFPQSSQWDPLLWEKLEATLWEKMGGTSFEKVGAPIGLLSDSATLRLNLLISSDRSSLHYDVLVYNQQNPFFLFSLQQELLHL